MKQRKQRKKEKTMFRIVSLMLILIAAVMMGACQNKEETDGTTTEAQIAELSTEVTTEEMTPAPTEPLTLEPSEVKIGMIFYGEENDDSVLTASLRSELIQAAADLGIGEDQILWQYNSREADWTQIEESILFCVDAGCQMIFGGAREYAAVIAAIAEEYPNVMFSCVGSDLMNGTNSGTYQISLAAAQYLCGVRAAAVNTTGHIGFLASKDSENSEVTNAVNAFAYGVWTVNPDAVVEVAVTGKWYLPEAETQAIAEMQTWNCDIVGGCTDSGIGMSLAADSGMSILPCGADMTALYGDAYASRMAGAALYQWYPYFSMKLNQVIQKEVNGEAWSGDYCTDAVTILGTEHIPESAWNQFQSWMSDGEEMQESDTESAAEPDTEMDSESLADLTGSENEVISPVTIDEDTGYLTNIRIHTIEVSESNP